MRKQLTNKLTALLLAGGMLLSMTAPAWAAETEITISTVKEFTAFAQSCSLDTWSQGKTIRLTADLDLTGTDFAPIPTFGGTFWGDGHTIKGLSLTASGSQQGLFRYLQSGGTISDLTVEGRIQPEGSRTNVGGIVGINSGVIQNCTFQGSVKGDVSVGGIVGLNREQGQINGCSASGVVQGQTRAGGIAGKNLGILLKCSSSASVNTSEEPVALGVDTADALNQLTDTSTEEAAQDGHTDTGGIVGYSSGVVQSCTNTGSVGYPHVGYNVGGIAGRQTGYLSGCINSGTVLGRKDVGGIAGQAEPYIAMNPSSDVLDRLRRELDTLDSLISQALDDADKTGDDLSVRLSSMGQITDSAQESSKRLLDHTADFIDGGMDSLNSITATVINALDKAAPALDELDVAAQWSESLFGHLEDGVELLKLPEADKEALRSAIRKLDKAGNRMTAAAWDLKDALDKLTDALVRNDRAAAEKTRSRLQVITGELGGAYRAAGAAVGELSEAIETQAPDTDEEIDSGFIVTLPKLEDLQAALERLADAMDAVNGALSDIQAALPLISSALDDALSAADTMERAASDLMNALDGALLDGRLDEALDELLAAASDAQGMSRSLQRAFQTLSQVMKDLAEEGPTQFPVLGEDVRNAGEDLYTSLGDLSREMAELNTSMQSNGDVLTADIRAINRQFNTVFDVLMDALSGLVDGEGTDAEDYIQDTSDENIAATRLGKVADCRSTGTVEGDRNVGGILGSMAIEYDLDPEDDIDRFSFNSTYETKAVLENCINRGTVSGKKDCMGGLVGRMDLGTVIDCQNYGAVESAGGDYVGGVAGRSDGSIRRCYVKCTLSGNDYVGGLAGWTGRLTDSCAIATILDGTEFVGAVAGNADLEKGVIRNNCFVDTGTAAIDGISYAGKAAPVAFEELRQRKSIPAEFVSFTLTLLADGETVAEIPFLYGNDLSLVELPKVPEREDAYGTWPDFDTSGLKSDITLEAVYTPWVTLVDSEERSGKLSLALAEGRFTENAELHVTDSESIPPQEDASAVWDIELSGTELTGSDTVPLRLFSKGSGRATVWQLMDGEWKQVDTTRSGQYLLLSMTGTTGTFCICGEQNGGLAMLWVLLAVAVLLLLVVVIVVKRRRRKKVE